ncbi:MAG: response regulator [Deltaproteobacteria bacterium]|nr:response regulator [Deltaproteobacteria bacterium]MBW1792858.1 response regulator [Deltaproteobacteria bacterium]MBW2329915.1 response regulator [Deltaproteobacteria bacterium]
MANAQVLVVEDEGVIAKDIENTLKNLGYAVPAIAFSGEEAIKKAAETHPDLVLMDIVLEGEMDGVEAAEQIRHHLDIPVVYLTAYANDKTLERAKVTEPYGYILKPFEERELHTAIEIALYKHEMERKLKESEQWLSTTLKSIGDAVIATDANGFVTFMNPVAEALTGWKQEDVAGKPLSEVFNIINEETGKQAEDPATRVLREGFVVGLANHTVLIAKDGMRRPIDDSGAPIRDDKGNIIGVVLVFRDITERRQAEKALAAEKERLAVTLRSIGDGVITTDTEGRIVLINKVAEKLTAWLHEEATGKPLTEVFHIINEHTRKRCENPFEKVIKTNGIVGLANDTALIARDGTERVIADSGAPIRDKDGNIIGVVLVFRDVTEKRRLEQELINADKLESVGVLAGGIAHDFNNILTGILGNITLAKIYAKPDDKIFEKLRGAENASLRAKHLTQQLLTFSRGGAPIKKTVFISELLKDAAVFALSGSNVRCEFSIPGDVWPVEVDEGQITQVINNLIINASQAMPEGGIIRARAENIVVDAEQGLPLKEGKYMKISIEDRGIGIPEEHLQKIFDPYFTSKQKGSGLGLATAYSIVKRHDGCIRVKSELGVGSTFHIYLPASSKEALIEKELRERIPTGKGKILIMDDEDLVREVGGEMLDILGYEVEFAEDGAEAIELYKKAKESAQPFDAIIMDLTIPGRMGGKEAVEKLIEIDPEVKAIVSSGYSTDPIMADFRKYGFSGVVAKPYELNELGEALHKVIAGRTSPRK